MGRAAAYNPTTGTYARGAAAYGEYDARAWAEAYNPRTGTYARSVQGSNVYGHWGTTAVVRGDEWVRGGRATGGEGSVAAVRTSSGGSTVVARGDNNVYVGKDGQVYRRTSSGWEQYDAGQWSGNSLACRSGYSREPEPRRGASVDGREPRERGAVVAKQQLGGGASRMGGMGGGGGRGGGRR